jgi:hypothetical protein
MQKKIIKNNMQGGQAMIILVVFFLFISFADYKTVFCLYVVNAVTTVFNYLYG